jgi:chromosome segregation ATPase
MSMNTATLLARFVEQAVVHITAASAALQQPAQWSPQVTAALNSVDQAGAALGGARRVYETLHDQINSLDQMELHAQQERQLSVDTARRLREELEEVEDRLKDMEDHRMMSLKRRKLSHKQGPATAKKLDEEANKASRRANRAARRVEELAHLFPAAAVGVATHRAGEAAGSGSVLLP